MKRFIDHEAKPVAKHSEEHGLSIWAVIRVGLSLCEIHFRLTLFLRRNLIQSLIHTFLTFLGSMSSKWFCTNCTLLEKSDWLNSYGMFQPKGPNFRRSCNDNLKTEKVLTIIKCSNEEYEDRHEGLRFYKESQKKQ